MKVIFWISCVFLCLVVSYTFILSQLLTGVSVPEWVVGKSDFRLGQCQFELLDAEQPLKKFNSITVAYSEKEKEDRAVFVRDIQEAIASEFFEGTVRWELVAKKSLNLFVFELEKRVILVFSNSCLTKQTYRVRQPK